MFSNKNKAKIKTKRPAPGVTAAVNAQSQKPGEKPRTVKAAVNKDTGEGKDARSASSTSSLNPHLFFEGNLKFSGTVLIDCDFRGTVVTDDTLVVGASGSLHAEVTAGVVEISGKVHGNIKASNSVKVFSGGEVHGNIETPTISMEEGVVFEGNCTRPGNRPQPEPVAETPQEAQVNEPARPAQPEPPTLETAREKMIVSATASTKRPRSSGRSKRTRPRDLVLTS